MSTKVAVVFSSGYGHTEEIARHVATGAGQVDGVEVKAFHLEKEDLDWDFLDGADAIIMGSPTYMGNVSAAFAKFKDESSKRWFEMKWKNKIAAGFTTSASWSGDKSVTLISLQTLALQHAMLWVGNDLFPGNNKSTGSPDDLNRVGSFSGLMIQANMDQGVEGMRESDFATARHFGERVATVAKRWSGN